MSHTCGRREVKALAAYVEEMLRVGQGHYPGPVREGTYRGALEFVEDHLAHIASCMERGPDDKEEEDE